MQDKNQETYNLYNAASNGAIAIRAERKGHESRKAQHTTIRYIGHDDNSIVFHVCRTIAKRNNDSLYMGYDLAQSGDLHFVRVTELRITKGEIAKNLLGVCYIGINQQIASWVTMPILD